MTFTPTPEQTAIVTEATTTDRNLLISALAGAAKTSTLLLLAEALSATMPGKEFLCLAFNKKIADEMNLRLPDNCTAMTLNSLGHRTWSGAIGRRLRINFKKTYEIVKALIEEQAHSDKQELYPRMAELMRIVDFSKSCGYIPTDTYPRAKPLMDDEDFFPHIEQKLSLLEEDIVRAAALQSLKMAHKGNCDFNDQILMPTCFMGAFPLYPITLVDEAQDLSALNHAMLRKMIGSRRLIAVGDQCQAIYGFRGAHEEGMVKLRHDFDMKEMTLSISFRCPRAVVEHARQRAPHMKYPEWAIAGEVRTWAEWTADDLEEDAAIICRNNAPLFSIAIKLLREGRTVELGGRDVVNFLLKIMNKFGAANTKQPEVLAAIDAWEEREKSKNKERAHGSIEDRAACMRVFATEGATLGDAVHYAHHLAEMHSPLKLMTGHKAKGLEFDHVYFLDSHLISKKDQDPNVRYVIQTRAKNTLTYIQSSAFKTLRSTEPAAAGAD